MQTNEVPTVALFSKDVRVMVLKDGELGTVAEVDDGRVYSVGVRLDNYDGIYAFRPVDLAVVDAVQ